MNQQANITEAKTNKFITEREFEKHLRDAGFSIKESKIIVSKGFKELIHRDDELDFVEVKNEIKKINDLLTGGI